MSADDLEEEFRISSGAVCFGYPHNIHYGASQLIQTPGINPTRPCGTVFCQQGQRFNYAAVNGKWRVHRFLDSEMRRTSAFFCCHESIEQPLLQIRHLLRNAGNPYEADSGNPHENNEESFQKRIVLINRYDWGMYDKRDLDKLPSYYDLLRPPFSLCLLVDYSSAMEAIDRHYTELSSSSSALSSAADDIVCLRRSGL